MCILFLYDADFAFIINSKLDNLKMNTFYLLKSLTKYGLPMVRTETQMDLNGFS